MVDVRGRGFTIAQLVACFHLILQLLNGAEHAGIALHDRQQRFHDVVKLCGGSEVGGLSLTSSKSGALLRSVARTSSSESHVLEIPLISGASPPKEEPELAMAPKTRTAKSQMLNPGSV